MVPESFERETRSFCEHLSMLEREITERQTAPAALTGRITDAIISSRKICAQAEQYSTADLPQLQRRLRESIAPWFRQSWFMYRATVKPRGYPGDYGILEGIYDRQPRSEGIGESLDRFFLDSTLAAAVRGRKDRCREYLDALLSAHPDRPVRILDIACGPCRELRESEWARRHGLYEFVGLDHDDEALDYARRKVAEAGIPGARARFVKQNVLRLTSAERNLAAYGRFDMIYSVGLYDYLTDAVLVRLISATAAMLADDGVYIAAFKDSNRYSKTEYQWLVDWHFFQRTEEECRRLLEETGTRITRVERDETGVILFFFLQKA